MTPKLRRQPNETIQLLSMLSGDGKRYVCVIEAYLDESGLDGRWPMVCVGAYAGTHEQWARFIESWQHQLDTAGVKVFHAKEQSSRLLHEPMVNHINEHQLCGFI